MAYEYKKPTGFTDPIPGWNNEGNAYDFPDTPNDQSTCADSDAGPADTDPWITFHTWAAKGQTYTETILYINWKTNGLYSDDQFAIRYTKNGGANWYDLVAMGVHNETTIQQASVTLDANQDLTLVEVKLVYDKAKGGDDGISYVYDIWTRGEYEAITPKTVADALSLIEEPIAPKAYIPISDTFALADAIPIIEVAFSLTDSLALAEVISPKLFKGVADSVALAETVTAAPAVTTKTITDALALADQVPSILVSFTLIESLSLAETPRIKGYLSIPDSLTLGEVISPKGVFVITDSLSLADALSLKAYLNLTESLNLTEVAGGTRLLSIPDALSLAEVIGLKIPVVVTDGLGITEVLSLRASLTISDTLTLAESISLRLGITIQDSLALAEAITTVATKYVSIMDSLRIRDNMDGGTPVLVKLTPAVFAELTKRGKPKAHFEV